jgi:hypothetical protein
LPLCRQRKPLRSTPWGGDRAGWRRWSGGRRSGYHGEGSGHGGGDRGGGGRCGMASRDKRIRSRSHPLRTCHRFDQLF